MRGYLLSYCIWDENICPLFRVVCCIVVSINGRYTVIVSTFYRKNVFKLFIKVC